MRYLTVNEVLELHQQIIQGSGGVYGLHDWGALESAVAQSRMTFDDAELYPSIVEKASALGFSLIQNHPFVDGNKRVGHAAMEVLLVLNGYQIEATVDEQEEIILQVASGQVRRDAFTDWLRAHIIAL
ncbi:MAG: type II toxin-antitoxin system death-on-curing family toxin [Caldilineaceae bacterium]